MQNEATQKVNVKVNMKVYVTCWSTESSYSGKTLGILQEKSPHLNKSAVQKKCNFTDFTSFFLYGIFLLAPTNRFFSYFTVYLQKMTTVKVMVHEIY